MANLHANSLTGLTEILVSVHYIHAQISHKECVKVKAKVHDIRQETQPMHL